MVSEGLANLIKHLESSTSLPIKLHRIHSWIIQNGHLRKIIIRNAPLPPEIVRGQARILEPTRSEEVSPGVLRILVARELEPTWRRFVLCKEMMHAFDSDRMKTSSDQDVTRIVEGLSNFAFDLTTIEQRSLGEVADHFAIIAALLALVPLNGLRTELQHKHRTSAVSRAGAAAILGIPLKHIDLVLTSHFDGLAEQVLN